MFSSCCFLVVCLWNQALVPVICIKPWFFFLAALLWSLNRVKVRRVCLEPFIIVLCVCLACVVWDGIIGSTERIAVRPVLIQPHEEITPSKMGQTLQHLVPQTQEIWHLSVSCYWLSFPFCMLVKRWQRATQQQMGINRFQLLVYTWIILSKVCSDAILKHQLLK